MKSKMGSSIKRHKSLMISKLGSTYSILDLSLECLDLALEFVNEVLESLLVLPVFVRLEGQFLEAAVSLAHVLHGLSVTALFSIEFTLKFTYLEDRKDNRSLFE